MEATTCKYLEVAHLPLKEIKLSLGIHEVGRTKELTAPSLLSTKCFDYFEFEQGSTFRFYCQNTGFRQFREAHWAKPGGRLHF